MMVNHCLSFCPVLVAQQPFSECSGRKGGMRRLGSWGSHIRFFCLDYVHTSYTMRGGNISSRNDSHSGLGLKGQTHVSTYR